MNIILDYQYFKINPGGLATQTTLKQESHLLRDYARESWPFGYAQDRRSPSSDLSRGSRQALSLER
jgi:hypothetical protein